MTYHFKKTTDAFKIAPEVAEHAQQTFVNQRQKEAESEDGLRTDDQTFHRWLTLSRYLSLADGQISLSKQTFDHAVWLD